MDLYIFILNITRPGGTERAVSNLANMLSGHYHVSVVSLCSTEKNDLYFYLEDSVDVLHLGMPELDTNIYSKVKWFYSVYKKVDQLKLNNSILIGTGHNINLLLPFWKRKNVKVVGCEHIQFDSISWFYRLIILPFYLLLNAIVVLSHSAEKKLKQHMAALKNIFVIPNSLSFIPLKTSDLTIKRIIMVGRLSPEKGYERVVRIASFMQRKFPDWNIVIFGDGLLKEKLNSLFINMHLSNIEICHSVPDIMKEYINSTIFMMTSYSEAMPMVILEANVCGLPVVAFECEGTKELIKDGGNGFLIKNDDYIDFEEKISLLMSDYDTRKYMSEEALRYSYNFQPERIVKAWMSLIDMMN